MRRTRKPIPLNTSHPKNPLSFLMSQKKMESLNIRSASSRQLTQRRRAKPQYQSTTASQRIDSKNDSKEKEGEDNEEGDEEDSDKEQKQEGREVEKKVDGRCVVPKCSGYNGPNLKRHVTNVHVKKGHIKADDMARLFSLGRDGSKKRGPKRRNSKGKAIKGRPKWWCPETDCEYLGAYLPEHLQNQHRMKTTSATYKLALKVARRFNGLKAELENIVEPRPAIQEIRVPSPPSSPSPKSTPSKLWKRPRESNESSDEDEVPPTPAKKPVRAVRPAPPAAPAPPVALPPPAMGAPPAKQPLPAAVDLEGRAETNQQRMDECTYRLQTEDVKGFLASSVVVSAQKVFTKAHDKNLLTLKWVVWSPRLSDHFNNPQDWYPSGRFRELKDERVLWRKTQSRNWPQSPPSSSAQEARWWTGTSIHW